VEKSGNLLDSQGAERRDLLLWERTARKDKASFCELFDRRAPAILGVLCKLLSRSEAEEVLQDVFRDVWREAVSFSPNGTSPFAWMLLRARARACERLRSRNAR
jgi:RNA polymerase sigma-70 factor (ECF subfamily)